MTSRRKLTPFWKSSSVTGPSECPRSAGRVSQVGQYHEVGAVPDYSKVSQVDDASVPGVPQCTRSAAGPGRASAGNTVDRPGSSKSLPLSLTVGGVRIR